MRSIETDIDAEVTFLSEKTRVCQVDRCEYHDRHEGHTGHFAKGRFVCPTHALWNEFLETIADLAGDAHGSTIRDRLQERTRKKFSYAYIFPVLGVLRDAGLLTREKQGDRFVFALTPEGRRWPARPLIAETWQCRWCSSENAIGLACCERCRMERG